MFVTVLEPAEPSRFQNETEIIEAWNDALLGQMDVIAARGKIRKGDKREANGFRCRGWIASVPAPAGWRDVFGVCVDSDDLPREVFTPDRSEVISYSDWNQPIKIDAPTSDQILKTWR